tara:strand:- start:1929 stop:2417 length:489 start_codon:yes stop_codon:yes gene_type:complete
MTIEYCVAWHKNDPRYEADARVIWSDPELLPDNNEIEIRAKQLAIVAYSDGQLAAMTTLNVRPFDHLRQKFAFIRGYVTPAFRLNAVGRDIMRETQKMIENWALDNPEEQIAGMAAVIQVPGVGQNPAGGNTGLVLMGYTQSNEQVRAAWFEHFRIPGNFTN